MIRLLCRSIGPALLLALLLPLAACGGDDGGDGTGGGGADAGAECQVAEGEPLPFMCPCDVADDQCDSAGGEMCFGFNNKGPHCTRACQGDEDCPAPSGGCGNMGVCRPPG